MSKKRFILLDPFEDKTMLHIFKDLQDMPYIEYDCTNNPQQWRKTATKIGLRCKEMIEADPPFLHPPVTSRTRIKKGFILKGKNTDFKLVDCGNKKKLIYKHKIF